MASSQDDNVEALMVVIRSEREGMDRFKTEMEGLVRGLSSEVQALQSRVDRVERENQELKKLNRLIWHLARKMSRKPYDLLCERLEGDSEFRREVATLINWDTINIRDVIRDFFDHYPQYKENGAATCAKNCLRYLCCCCCS